MQKADSKQIFEEFPVSRAVVSLAVPTVISQLIVLIYNMADTWFIGQTGDPVQVAAVTVAFPVFMLLNAIANLFGIGGGSLLSRLLGSGQRKKCSTVAAFTIWASAGTALLFSMTVWGLRDTFLSILGADGQTAVFAEQYLFWAVVAGGIPTVLGLVFANLIRAEGNAKAASIGMSLGGILNVVLDPIFIFYFGMDVSGAALATCLSNTASLLFMLFYIIRNQRNSTIKAVSFPRLRELSGVREIFSIGTPAALQIVLASISNSVLLRLMSGYAAAAISGVGIMQKVEIIPFQIVQGISSGVLPLIAYNYAAGNYKRMNESVRMALRLGAVVAIVFFVGFEIFAAGIVRFFISDADTIAYGTVFLRLRLLAIPFITIEFMLIAVFQGIGGAKQAFLLSIFRKGILDLPLMYLMNLVWPMYGLMLVQPIMETCGAAIALTLYTFLHKNLTQPKRLTMNENAYLVPEDN